MDEYWFRFKTYLLIKNAWTILIRFDCFSFRLVFIISHPPFSVLFCDHGHRCRCHHRYYPCVRAHSGLNFSKKIKRERGFVYACWLLGVSAFTIETKKRICYHPSSVELSFSLTALAIPSIMFHHHWHIFPMSQSLYLYYLSHFDLLLNLEAYTMRIIHMYIRGGSILQLYSSLSV